MIVCIWIRSSGRRRPEHSGKIKLSAPTPNPKSVPKPKSYQMEDNVRFFFKSKTGIVFDVMSSTHTNGALKTIRNFSIYGKRNVEKYNVNVKPIGKE